MRIGGLHTTEDCNLACIMCPYHGPGAPKKEGSLDPELVKKYLRGLPRGEKVWFASSGELFMDKHALDYLQYAKDIGLEPCVITNGLLLPPRKIDAVLDIGVRRFRISVDTIDAEHYALVRPGGKFENILKTCEYLRSQKGRYPDVYVEINNVLLEDTISRQDEFIKFWKGKVDQVNFNAEYYDTLKFRNTLYNRPKERVECELRVFLLASGRMSPCCAINVLQHYHDLDWLPHIADTSPETAYKQFQVMYYDPSSPLSQICKNCEWWILWAKNENGETPYMRSVVLNKTNSGSFKHRFLQNLKQVPLVGNSLLLLKRQYMKIKRKERSASSDSFPVIDRRFMGSGANSNLIGGKAHSNTSQIKIFDTNLEEIEVHNL